MRLRFCVILLILVTTLFSYQPKEYNFKNRYQYQIYLSWIQCGFFRKDTKANITSKQISMNYDNRFNQYASVYLELDDFKIVKQREKLPLQNKYRANFKNFHPLVEEIVYLLNCRDMDFIKDYLVSSGIEIEYSLKEGKSALNQLWREKEFTRFTPIKIDYSLIKNQIVAEVSTSLNTITIVFPDSKDTQIIIEKIKHLEKQKEEIIAKKITEKKINAEELKSNSNNEVDKEFSPIPELNFLEKKTFQPIITKNDSLNDKLYSLLYGKNITKFVMKNMNKIPNHKLIQTEITNPTLYLRTSFPTHKLEIANNYLALTTDNINRHFYADLFLELDQREDVVYFYPDLNFKKKKNIVTLPNNEEISFLDMNDIEISKSIPIILQTLMIHRSLGTPMFWSLAYQDYVDTTLSIHDEERIVLSFHTYAELQRLLNKFWWKQKVYFSINEVRKLNDSIEFKGYLAVKIPKSNKYNYAEIRFRLNDNYEFDVIMMILHPETEF